jgi:AcrR family transcriptional regulator
VIARNGYLAVNMTDIGNAVGISGSGVYRHFASKSEILLTLLDVAVDGLVAEAEQAKSSLADPQSLLEALVDGHVSFTLTQREVCLIYLQESRNLPEADQRRLRWKQRRYLDLWLDALALVRDDLSPEEVKVVVHACISAIHSALQYQTSLDDETQAQRLRTVALATLGLSRLGATPVAAR